MRYIGNKTKLLDFMGSFLDELCLHDGRALDAFAGTASVASYLKARGFTVEACDIMSFSYVLQRAYVVADAYPTFQGLAADPDFRRVRRQREFASEVASRFAGQVDLFPRMSEATRHLEEVLVYLDTFLPPKPSFITRHFSADAQAAGGERMYFTRLNAARIDAVRHKLEEWRSAGAINEDEYYILLAALLEAADAAANTTGVYAAYVKTWQGNAQRPLRLQMPDLTVGTHRAHQAHQQDVAALVGTLGELTLLYLDPPYNTRQYSAYYHVPELIAEGWFESQPDLRGKTGLIPNDHKKSAWSTRDGCAPALERLLSKVNSVHVLMSYNNEGIIPETEIERIFRRYGIRDTYRRVGQDYKRYRSDSDSNQRQYTGDEVTEYLYYVRLK
ncbi:MAG: DNA adenine methylase [Gemmatimonadetes bacterium]|nr:DNA adenine methylase [Gemmatimonadota bacterium]